MGFKPKARQTTDFERVTFPAGPNTMTLDSLRIRNFENTYNGKTENKMKVMAPWKDEEGDEFMDFLGCPKEFAYNEKSAFWNRVVALAGMARKLNDDDLDDFDFTIEGVDENSEDPWADLNALIYDENGDPRLDSEGRAVAVYIKSITYKGEELIGKQAVLNLKPKYDQQGNELEGNKIAADGAMPLGVSGSKKKGGSAASPAAASAMP